MLNKENMNISGEEEKPFFNNSNKKETLNESDFFGRNLTAAVTVT
jgi:hypothetical protein